MNTADTTWIIDTVCDFMIAAKEIHKYKTFSITAYSNSTQFKIPVLFQIGDNPIEHLVLDYNEYKRLEECEGINDYGEFIRLNCELQKLKEVGYINYYINDDLTQLLNQRLNKRK
jgi:hypothetical protein